MQVSSFVNNSALQEKYSAVPAENPYLVFPALFDLIGDPSGTKVLDAGCGDGTFSHLLAERGAIVKGIDIASNWIDQCRDSYAGMEGLTFEIADACDLAGEKDGSYDTVIMNMVLLMVERKEDLLRMIGEAGRVLKKGGAFIFSDLHPLCKIIPETPTQKQTLPDDFSYFTEGAPYFSEVRLSDGTLAEFTDIHWNLETFSKAVSKAGMLIERIAEPAPVTGSPALFDNYKLPEYIIFRCVKY